MAKLDGVPVKTRLPVSAWVLAALVTLFSVLSSLVATGGTEQIYQASMTELLAGRSRVAGVGGSYRIRQTVPCRRYLLPARCRTRAINSGFTHLAWGNRNFASEQRSPLFICSWALS